MFKLSRLSALVVFAILVLLMLPSVARAQEGACTATIVVDLDLGVGVYEVPSINADLVTTLNTGDEVLALNRLANWLLVQTDAGMGYLPVEAAELSAACDFIGDDMPGYLQELVVLAIVLLGSGASGTVLTYVAQAVKLGLRALGVEGQYGGKIMLVIGVLAVQIAIGANVLGVRDALTEHFELAARVLGSAVAILVALLSYPKLKAARLMPGARAVEIEAVALTAESSPGPMPYSELVERVKVLEQKHLEDQGMLEDA
jgi:hypothetical protein